MNADDVRMLADLGFLALSRGLDEHAMAIFEGVKAVRPEQEAGHLGAALVLMLRNDLDGAVKILRGLGPGDAARTFLGIALSKRGDLDEARRLLAGVASSSAGTSHGKLASEMLAELDNKPRG